MFGMEKASSVNTPNWIRGKEQQKTISRVARILEQEDLDMNHPDNAKVFRLLAEYSERANQEIQ